MSFTFRAEGGQKLHHVFHHKLNSPNSAADLWPQLDSSSPVGSGGFFSHFGFFPSCLQKSPGCFEYPSVSSSSPLIWCFLHLLLNECCFCGWRQMKRVKRFLQVWSRLLVLSRAWSADVSLCFCVGTGVSVFTSHKLIFKNLFIYSYIVCLKVKKKMFLRFYGFFLCCYKSGQFWTETTGWF